MNGDVSIDDFMQYVNKINERIKALDTTIDKSYCEIVNQKLYGFEMSNSDIHYSILHRTIKKVYFDMVKRK